MSGDLVATLRALVRDELARLRTAELAVVQELHPHASDSDGDNYACTVALRDSGLVLSRVPVATQRVGSVAIPEVGELVLVQFIGGELNAPVITGRLYNDEDRPPANDAGQAVVHLPLGAADSDAVHGELRSGGERSLTLRLGDALEIHLKDDDPVVEVAIDGGKATLQVERDGAVSVVTQGDLTVEGGKIEVKGQEINVEASGPLTLKGATIDLN